MFWKRRNEDRLQRIEQAVDRYLIAAERFFEAATEAHTESQKASRLSQEYSRVAIERVKEDLRTMKLINGMREAELSAKSQAWKAAPSDEASDDEM